MKTLMQETSLEAYYSLEDLGKKQKAVYSLLCFGQRTNRQTARALGWEINRVTPRVNELVRMGLVKDYGTEVDPQTRKRAILWGIAKQEQQTRFA